MNAWILKIQKQDLYEDLYKRLKCNTNEQTITV